MDSDKFWTQWNQLDSDRFVRKTYAVLETVVYKNYLPNGNSIGSTICKLPCSLTHIHAHIHYDYNTFFTLCIWKVKQ